MFMFSLGSRREIILSHFCVLTVSEKPVIEFRCKNPSGVLALLQKSRTPMFQEQKVS